MPRKRREEVDVGMRRLHGNYAQAFNARHGRSGHVFQGRYGAIRVKSDSQLWTVARYIALNPVDAGLCERPHQWPWSSSSATLSGGRPDWLDVDRLLWFFNGLGGDSRRRYAELITGAATAPPPQS